MTTFLIHEPKKLSMLLILAYARGWADRAVMCPCEVRNELSEEEVDQISQALLELVREHVVPSRAEA